MTTGIPHLAPREEIIDHGRAFDLLTPLPVSEDELELNDDDIGMFRVVIASIRASTTHQDEVGGKTSSLHQFPMFFVALLRPLLRCGLEEKDVRFDDAFDVRQPAAKQLLRLLRLLHDLGDREGQQQLLQNGRHECGDRRIPFPNPEVLPRLVRGTHVHPNDSCPWHRMSSVTNAFLTMNLFGRLSKFRLSFSPNAHTRKRNRAPSGARCWFQC